MPVPWPLLCRKYGNAARPTSCCAISQVSLSGLPNNTYSSQLPPQDIRLAALQLTPWLLDMRHRCFCFLRMNVISISASRASCGLTKSDCPRLPSLWWLRPCDTAILYCMTPAVCMLAGSDARIGHALMLWSCYRRCSEGILPLLQSPCAALHELRLLRLVVTADGAAQLAAVAGQLRVLHLDQ